MEEPEPEGDTVIDWIGACVTLSLVVGCCGGLLLALVVIWRR